MARTAYVFYRRGIRIPRGSEDPKAELQPESKRQKLASESEDVNPLYETLPFEDCVRYLKIISIDPDATSTGPRMVCTLHGFHLDDLSEDYAALSYTWGRPFTDCGAEYDEDVVISVRHHGDRVQEHRISRNLYEALVQVHRSEWQSYLWVDSICIDQNDPREKASQVQRMGTIYANAQKTIAWLGKAGPEESDISYLFGPFGRYISEWQERHGPDSFPPIAAMPHPLPEGVNETRFVDSDVVLSIRQISELFLFLWRVRYLGRLWTIQEIALSEEVVFLYGSSTLPAESHLVLPRWLAAHFQLLLPIIRPRLDELNVYERTLPSPGTQIALQIKAWAEELNDGDHYSQKMEDFQMSVFGEHPSRLAWLERLLAMTGTLDCSNVRDRYYGLLGLLQLTGPSLAWSKSSTVMPRPDYGLSVEEVYRSLSADLLTGLPHMTALGLLPVHHLRRLKSLPSWAIDLTTQSQGMGEAFGGLQGRLVSQGQKIPSNAACHLLDKLDGEKVEDIEVSGDTLLAYGSYCDRVKMIHEPDSSESESGDASENQILTMAEHLEILALTEQFSPHCVTTGGHSALEAVIVSSSLCPWMMECDLPSPSAGKGNATSSDTDTTKHISAFWAAVLVMPTLHREVERSGSSDAIASSSAYLARFWQQFSALRSHGALPPSIAALDDISTESLYHVQTGTELSAWNRKALEYAGEVGKLMGHRAITVTERGYVGSVPRGTRVGDEIWVLCRGRVPVVLRPVDEKAGGGDEDGDNSAKSHGEGRYIVLGEAYIHGGMHGELVENTSGESVRKIKIV